MVDCSNVSSRGLLEADVAMANAAAAVDVLLLMMDIQLHPKRTHSDHFSIQMKDTNAPSKAKQKSNE